MKLPFRDLVALNLDLPQCEADVRHQGRRQLGVDLWRISSQRSGMAAMPDFLDIKWTLRGAFWGDL